jgi:hypothetical protein
MNKHENAHVSWPPSNETPDDAVFVYRHKDNGVLVYGMFDARKHQQKLFDAGYKHTATIKASVLLERVMNMESIHDVWEAIHFADS